MLNHCVRICLCQKAKAVFPYGVCLIVLITGEYSAQLKLGRDLCLTQECLVLVPF